MVYVTKICPMNKICVDPASLFKTQKKKIFFLPSFLESLRTAVWTDVPVQVLTAPFHPQINPLHFPSVSLAVWATKLGNEALILKSLLNL